MSVIRTKNRIQFAEDFVLNNGKIGIATNDPQQTLDVVGNIGATGLVTASQLSAGLYQGEVRFLDNVFIDGNISIAGTQATVNTTTLRIEDADIILGFTTNQNGDEVSNDDTANHGGIAIASTEGTPLSRVVVTGIETLPATYKKIMWFKSDTFSGVSTDAWMINYGVSIGNTTNVPDGTRLAAGDVLIGQDDITAVRNVNATGIITGNTAYFTNLDVTGVSTFNNNISLGGTSGVSNITGLSRLDFNYEQDAVNIIIGNDDTGNAIDLDLGWTIENVFVGLGAGYDFQQGHGNTFIGWYVGSQSNLSGNEMAFQNNIIGYLAAQKLTSGSFNQGLGSGVLRNLTSGEENIAIGNYTGTAVTTGENNILLGRSANVINGSDSFNIVIGKDITVNGNNNLAIGIDGEKLITGVKDGSVDLYYNNSKKFETTTDGVKVTGLTTTQNLYVSGVSTFTGTITASNLNNVSIAATFIASPGVAYTMDSYALATDNLKTAEYTIHIENGNNIQSQKLLVMQNGTTAFSQEYAIMFDSDSLVSIASTLNAGVVSVEITPETGVLGLTTYRYTRQSII